MKHYFPILPLTCLFTKWLWHHACLCSNLEASTAQQMAECLHKKKCSQRSVARGRGGPAAGGSRGSRGPLLGEQHSRESPTLLGKLPTCFPSKNSDISELWMIAALLFLTIISRITKISCCNRELWGKSSGYISNEKKKKNKTSSNLKFNFKLNSS